MSGTIITFLLLLALLSALGWALIFGGLRSTCDAWRREEKKRASATGVVVEITAIPAPGVFPEERPFDFRRSSLPITRFLPEWRVPPEVFCETVIICNGPAATFGGRLSCFGIL